MDLSASFRLPRNATWPMPLKLTLPPSTASTCGDSQPRALSTWPPEGKYKGCQNTSPSSQSSDPCHSQRSPAWLALSLNCPPTFSPACRPAASLKATSCTVTSASTRRNSLPSPENAAFPSNVPLLIVTGSGYCGYSLATCVKSPLLSVAL